MKKLNKVIKTVNEFGWILSGIGIFAIKKLYDKFSDKAAETFYDSIIIPSTVAVTSILSLVIIYKLVGFLNQRGFFKFILCKLREPYTLIVTKTKYEFPVEYKYDCFHVKKYTWDLVKEITEFVCHTQGELAYYIYKAGNLHRKMKDAYRENPTDKEKLSELSGTLYSEIRKDFEKISKTSLKYLDRYFSIEKRSKYLPRFIVKCYDNNTTIDIYRKDWQYTKEYMIIENSGFQDVRDTGKSYICNDIPKKAAKDKYYNPRLNNTGVREYLEDLEKSKKSDDHEKWIKCWQQLKHGEGKEERLTPPPAESCYKSTLIVPMTLLNNDMPEDFKEGFQVPEGFGNENSEKDSRLIYGFLCCDHTERGYFKKEIDVKILYLFADLLSLYLINWFNYTHYSKTFRKIVAFVGDDKIETFD